VLHWVLPDGAVDKIGDYKELVVDAEYIRMLVEVGRQGFFHFDPDQQPSCQLKAYYESEGVVDSYVLFLAVVDCSFIYLSACRYDGKFTPHQVIELKLLANLIAHQLK